MVRITTDLKNLGVWKADFSTSYCRRHLGCAQQPRCSHIHGVRCISIFDVFWGMILWEEQPRKSKCHVVLPAFFVVSKQVGVALKWVILDSFDSFLFGSFNVYRYESDLPPQPITVAKKGVSKEVRNKIREVRSLKTNEIGRSWNKSMVQSRNSSLTHDQGTYVFLKPERNVSWKSYAELWEFVKSETLKITFPLCWFRRYTRRSTGLAKRGFVEATCFFSRIRIVEAQNWCWLLSHFG